MKRFVLILFSVWLVWTQSPLGFRSAAATAEEAACNCCSACGGSCGCVAPAPPNPQPLPPAASSLPSLTEIIFTAAPAHGLALPSDISVQSPLSISPAFSNGGVPLFRRDCALLL